jgi:sterol desaturase/sphingolipid hydroxylase (fatty acid hydroxylase superfamily)
MGMILLKWLFRIGLVPAILVGGNSLAIEIINHQLNHLWLVGVILSGIALSFTAEALIPYNTEWNESHNDRIRDAIHFIVNESANFGSVLTLPIIYVLVPGLGIWPDDWPLWAQLLLAIGVVDFGITFAHYASHRINWLWRFHAVHHSVKRMYGFNGLMKHPVHQFIEGIFGFAPLVLLGMPTQIAWLLIVAIALQLLLQHSNADMRIGPFKYLLALAPAHRFHHLNSARDGDVNFGLFTMIWDWLLGTASYDPRRAFTTSDLGIEGEQDYPASYISQLIAPFRSKGR